MAGPPPFLLHNELCAPVIETKGTGLRWLGFKFQLHLLSSFVILGNKEDILSLSVLYSKYITWR